MKTIALILIVTAAASAQTWQFVDISVDGQTRVDRSSTYVPHKDGDVEVWVKMSELYYGKWRQKMRYLIRYDCFNYGAYVVKLLTNTGKTVPINSFYKSETGTLIQEVGVSVCDDSANSQ